MNIIYCDEWHRTMEPLVCRLFVFTGPVLFCAEDRIC